MSVLYDGTTWTNVDDPNYQTFSHMPNNVIVTPLAFAPSVSTCNLAHYLWTKSSQGVRGNPVLIPSDILFKNNSGNVVYAGNIPDLFILNGNNHYYDEDIIALGGSDYVVSFPFPNCESDNLTIKSASDLKNMAVCFKKTA